MSLWSKVPYDRDRILREARRAAGARKRRRAIALYRRVLAVEPGNGELHARLAPLLAATGQTFDAWQSYRRAIATQLKAGKPREALVLGQAAVVALPRELAAWQELAGLERQQDRLHKAVLVLRAGARLFARRRRRGEAIYLLRLALELEPGQLETVLMLARLLARTGQGEEALALLDEVSKRARGRGLLRVRSAQWRALPSLSHTARWLGALPGALLRPRRGRGDGESAELAPSP